MITEYSSMNPGLEPAKRQSIERTNATMAPSMGKRAGICILAIE